MGAKAVVVTIAAYSKLIICYSSGNFTNDIELETIKLCESRSYYT